MRAGQRRTTRRAIQGGGEDDTTSTDPPAGKRRRRDNGEDSYSTHSPSDGPLSYDDNSVTSLCQGGRRRRRGTIDIEEGGECDKMSNIAGMGLMTLCDFEYDNDASFAARGHQRRQRQ
jgi:hypothetical protein